MYSFAFFTQILSLTLSYRDLPNVLSVRRNGFISIIEISIKPCQMRAKQHPMTQSTSRPSLQFVAPCLWWSRVRRITLCVEKLPTLSRKVTCHFTYRQDVFRVYSHKTGLYIIFIYTGLVIKNLLIEQKLDLCSSVGLIISRKSNYSFVIIKLYFDQNVKPYIIPAEALIKMWSHILFQQRLWSKCKDWYLARYNLQ